MGMRISGSGSTSQSAAVSQWQQRQQGVKDLMTSLQSGDLAGAQKAFANVTGGSGTVNPSSPLAAIGQALQNGDLAGAQQAAQQMQAQRHGHHHHGSSGSTPAVAATTTTSATTGSLLNLIA